MGECKGTATVLMLPSVREDENRENPSDLTTQRRLAQRLEGPVLSEQEGRSKEGSSFEKSVSEGKPQGEIMQGGRYLTEDGGSFCLMLVEFSLQGWRREGVMGGTQALKAGEEVR